MNLAQWRWKYLASNPAPPLSQLVFNTNGDLMGHAGTIALRGQAYGMPIPCYQIADVMIHPQARGYVGTNNVFTRLFRELLVQINQQHPQVLAYGFPGQRPFILGERALVYENVEQVQECVWNSNALPNNSGLHTTATTWSNIHFNRLWQRLQHQFPISLIRDADYINWRYMQNPFHSYQPLELSLFNQSIGWAIINIRGNEVLIVDLLIARNLCLQALGSISAWAKIHGLQTMRLWINANWRAKLPLIPVALPIIVTNTRWGLPWATEILRTDFYYTMGDVDIF